LNFIFPSCTILLLLLVNCHNFCSFASPSERRAIFLCLSYFPHSSAAVGLGVTSPHGSLRNVSGVPPSGFLLSPLPKSPSLFPFLRKVHSFLSPFFSLARDAAYSKDASTHFLIRHFLYALRSGVTPCDWSLDVLKSSFPPPLGQNSAPPSLSPLFTMLKAAAFYLPRPFAGKNAYPNSSFLSICFLHS